MIDTDRTLLWAFEGTAAPGPIIDRARAGLLAGVTLFRHHNVQSPAQVRALIDEISDATDGSPPLVAIDQEAGQFRALAGSTPFAGNLALGAADDTELTRSVARAIGDELRAVGINMDYAPVADIITQPNNPSLGVRSFGSDPHRVAAHVAAFVTGLDEAGVIAVTKHFPGKGEARVDPHHELPVLQLDRARLHDVELRPFQAAIQAGAGAVMAGHYALPLLTGAADLPATVSRDVITGLLRQEMGFDGLVLTDALDMGALSQGGGSTIEAIAALRAGIDLLLCSADLDRADGLAAGIRLAWRRGLIDDAVLAGSIRRSDRARAALAGGRQPALDAVGSSANQDLAAELASRSITLVRDDDKLLPIAPTTRVASIMVQPTDLTPADTSSLEPAALADALRARFVVATELVVGHEPTGAEIEAAVSHAQGAELTVVGTITASAAQAELVRRVAEVGPVVTAALRTPFDLLTYPEIGTHLCTYSVLRPSLDALADVLAGAPAPGILPAPVGDLYPVGHGHGHGHGHGNPTQGAS